MTADTPDDGLDDDDSTAVRLDQLGREAVAESNDAPPIRSRSRRSAALLAAAAAVVLVSALTVAVLAATSTADNDDLVAAPDTTAEHTSDDAPPTEATTGVVQLVFSPDPASTEDTLEVAVTNRTDRPWSFQCRGGQLSRWDDGAWQPVGGAVMWNQDTLTVFEEMPTLDCLPDEGLEPGATEMRELRPAATVTVGRGAGPDGSPAPLGPGRYRLEFAEQPADERAVGQFVLSGSVAPRPDQARATGASVACELLSLDELAAAAGLTPDSAAVVDGSDAEEQGCGFVAGPWDVGYTPLDVTPDQYGTMGSSEGPGDESYADISLDRSGLWSGFGAVRVGSRGVFVRISSDSRAADTYPPADGEPVGPEVQQKIDAVLEAIAARL